MTTWANDYGDDRYFTRLAAAFVRGRLGETRARGLSDAELIAAGLAAGLRLHKFKRNAELPRVRRVIGILRGLAPATLLDVGSGRGTFLWPLLDAFPDLGVTAVDTDPRRVADINAVREGGVANLRAVCGDAAALEAEDKSADVVTALEVLEHLPSPQRAAAEAVRVARGHVVASVPSKEDDNPEHIQLFDRRGFESLFLGAGARGVKVDFVLNHMIAVARV
ncbi:MAG TPA: class I SAM-dependent methyltransferase [Pyrinomonadaceae bacterium]|jgi:2-polyprenyl-3-methyl-5-hydroxy-6-metoxy-1,4-benzoquinol methylase|nr:class I SAM-dependent methyltransferase [Pyrinomonadaceae bacterium]